MAEGHIYHKAIADIGKTFTETVQVRIMTNIIIQDLVRIKIFSHTSTALIISFVFFYLHALQHSSYHHLGETYLITYKII